MNREDELVDNVKTLNLISYQIAELQRIKEELEARVCALLEHGNEGSKTYIVDKWKVTCKTGYNYSLDKEEYDILESHLKPCFNPVRKRVSYDLDKQVIRDTYKYACGDDLKLFNKLISRKPSKLAVTLKAGT